MVAIITGEMDMGKTTYVKEHFFNKSKKKKMVYALIKKDFKEDVIFFNNIKPFAAEAVKLHDTIFFVDEAKTCFTHDELDPTRKDPLDRNLLIWLENSRKVNNAIFISFKMLRDIPLWLLGYTQHLVRFKTMDQLDRQITRFKSFPTIVESLETYPTLERFDCDEIKIR